jgi:hypothetical protein
MSFRRSLFAAAFVLSGTAGAQSSALVDEGTFMVSRNGTPIGRESFRVVRAPAPGGQVYRATGQSALGDNRATSTLGTDSTGVPVSYEFELSQGGQIVQRLSGRGRPGRVSVLVQTKSGESAREYVSNNGALIIDEDVFHHFYFVPLIAGQHTAVNVIAPRVAQQTRFSLADRGEAAVEIGGRSLQGRHFALVGDDGATRDVWVDAKGRLLKVVIASRGMIAVRDDPPR